MLIICWFGGPAMARVGSAILCLCTSFDGHGLVYIQWRCQLWGTGAQAPSTFNSFIFSSLWSKSESQLSKYCVVCEISWCRCQQLTALLISTASVTKLLVIEQLLHSALKSTMSAHDIISIFAPPRNKSWRHHCIFTTESTGEEANSDKEEMADVSKSDCSSNVSLVERQFK